MLIALVITYLVDLDEIHVKDLEMGNCFDPNVLPALDGNSDHVVHMKEMTYYQ
jgi:hypothetical protein